MAGRAQDWRTSDPQHPLGRGMPPGRALRDDGESHDEWWMRIIRADPCAYCGAPGGTVDHIVPRSRRTQHLHDWVNYVGACEGCNGRKSDRPLLFFLAIRRR